VRLIWTLVSLGIAVAAVLIILGNVDTWTEEAALEADRATAEAYGIDPDTLDLPGVLTVTDLEVLDEGFPPEIRLRVENTGGRNLYNVHVTAELLNAAGKELWDDAEFYLEPTKLPVGDPAKGSGVVTEEGFASVGELRADDVLGDVKIVTPR
jgi:hypothetical protein